MRMAPRRRTARLSPKTFLVQKCHRRRRTAAQVAKRQRRRLPPPRAALRRQQSTFLRIARKKKFPRILIVNHGNFLVLQDPKDLVVASAGLRMKAARRLSLSRRQRRRDHNLKAILYFPLSALTRRINSGLHHRPRRSRRPFKRQPFPDITPLSSPVVPKRSLVLPSPLSTPTNKKPMKSREISTLPLPSPLNSQQPTITTKGKGRVVSQPTKGKSQGKEDTKLKSRRVLSSEEEDCVDETKPTRRPQPFPVAFSPQVTPRAPKRSSNGLDSDDDKARKKRREHLYGFIQL